MNDLRHHFRTVDDVDRAVQILDRIDRFFSWPIVIAATLMFLAIVFDPPALLYYVMWVWTWGLVLDASRAWWGHCPCMLGRWYCRGMYDRGDSPRFERYYAKGGGRYAWNRLCLETFATFLLVSVLPSALGLWALSAFRPYYVIP